MSHRGRYGCKIAGIGRDVCYIRFARTAVVVKSQLQLLKTVRDESIILDLDANGRLIGIELGGNKPCSKENPHG